MTALDPSAKLDPRMAQRAFRNALLSKLRQRRSRLTYMRFGLGSLIWLALGRAARDHGAAWIVWAE